MADTWLNPPAYAAASFTPIIDYVIIGQADLREYRHQLRGFEVHAALAPGTTADLILADRDRARLE